MGEDVPQEKIGATLVRVQPEEASDLGSLKAPLSVAARGARLVARTERSVFPAWLPQ
jgi:hypothetical protein